MIWGDVFEALDFSERLDVESDWRGYLAGHYSRTRFAASWLYRKASSTASPAGAWRHLSLQLVAKPQQVQMRQSLAHGEAPLCTLPSPTQGCGSVNADGSGTIQQD